MSLQKQDSDFINVSKNIFFDKEICVPSSKSYANRMLILAAISLREITLLNMPSSSDVSTMLNCFKLLNINYSQVGTTVTIKGSFPACESSINSSYPIVLPSGDGGTTNRFLIALLALGSNKYILKPTLAMINRPMDDLFTPLRSLSVHINELKDSWEIQGPIQQMDMIKVDCSKSTQFASALKMVLPNTQLETINLKASKLYFDLTIYLYDLFFKEKNHNKNTETFMVPVDSSCLGYPLAMGVTLGKCLIKNASEDIDAYQADGVLINILKKMGAKITFTDAGILIEKSDLQGITFDCILCPDLVPTLIYICSYAKGKSTLLNLEILKHKESNRLSEVFKILDLFCIKYQYDSKQSSLTIVGTDGALNFPVNCLPKPDHRMVMVSYMFLLRNFGGKLYNVSHVKKSYVNFFTDFT